MNKGRGTFNDADWAAWMQATRTVTPLSREPESGRSPHLTKTPHIPAPTHIPPAPPTLDLKSQAQETAARATPLPSLNQLSPTSEGFPSGENPPAAMNAKLLAKMKRGKLRPEARLDLHGATLAMARPMLNRFVLDAHESGKRLILVITGKGRCPVPQGAFAMPCSEGGALRRHLPIWLGSPPLRSVVLQVCPSHRSHGGAGACYVYLRRANRLFPVR